MTEPITPQYLTVAQAAALMQTTRKKIVSLLSTGRIKGIRLGDGPRAGIRILASSIALAADDPQGGRK